MNNPLDVVVQWQLVFKQIKMTPNMTSYLDINILHCGIFTAVLCSCFSNFSKIPLIDSSYIHYVISMKSMETQCNDCVEMKN